MKNVLESEIRNVYGELRDQNPEFCACSQCRDDALAIALNQLRPRYATSREPLVRAQLQREEQRTPIVVAVLEAMRRVSQNPRHPIGAPPAEGTPSA